MLPSSSKRDVALRLSVIALVMIRPLAREARAGAQASPDSASTGQNVPTSRLTSAPRNSLGVSVGTIDGGGSPTFSALLQGRVAGLDVLRSGGATAEGARVRSRGPASIAAERAPLLIVDGIRVSSDPDTPGISSAPLPSRLDDFAPDEIERIDVLRGPAAAALYGPGAAAGVIVVTTARGRPGALRWTARAEDGVTTAREDFPSNYQMAGISTASGQPMVPFCSLVDRMRQRCRPTTLAIWNPLEQASPFRVGRSSTAGVAVSGSVGSAVPLALHVGGTGRRDFGVTNDDEEQRYHLHGSAAQRFSLPVLGQVDLDLSAAYMRRDMSLPAAGNDRGAYNPIGAGLLGAAVDDSAHGYRTILYRMPSRSGGDVDRFVGTIGARWSPFSWLEGTLVAGRDRVAQRELRLMSYPFGATTIETHEVDRAHREVTSVNATAAASYTVTPRLRGRTIAALEREGTRDSTYQAALIYTPDFPDQPTGEMVTEWSGARMRGVWLREELAWNDRLFVNGALRWDRRSELGIHKSEGPYPSLDLSWRVGPTVAGADLRLRGAYGRVGSSVLPVPISYAPVTAGTPVPPLPKLETMSEYELGADASFHRRALLGLTVYRRDVDDLLIPIAGGASLSYVNGHMHTAGVEASVQADLARTSRFRWDATLTVGSARNRVDDLSGQPIAWLNGSMAGPNVVMPGHPYGGYWGSTYSFVDVNQNGQVDSSEVQSDGVMRFIGSSTPTVTVGLRSRLGLPLGIALSAAVDYHGGYKLDDFNSDVRCRMMTCRAMQDPSAPLQEQAAAYANWRYRVDPYLQDASFAKLRELSLTWSVPSTWSRQLGATDVAISIVGRNLTTWTRYRGLDPEISASGAELLPRSDFAVRPIPRQLVVRLDLGEVGSAHR